MTTLYDRTESNITMRFLGACLTIAVSALLTWDCINRISHRKCIESAFAAKVTDMDLAKRVCK